MSKAREAAARAFHGVLFAEGVIIQTNALDAAIDAFLASLCEDEDMVERVARLIHAATDKVNAWHADEADGSYLLPLGREEYRDIARAAIATLKQEAGQ